jgi:hypothetical protein
MRAAAVLKFHKRWGIVILRAARVALACWTTESFMGNLLTGVTRVDRGSTESQPARMAVKADQKTCR